MGSSKQTTTQQQTNSLPDWLTSPYRDAVAKAGTLAAQPALGSDTQTALNNLKAGAAYAGTTGAKTISSLSGLASGDFSASPAGTSLASTANGSALAANPWITNGQPAAVSGALAAYANGGQPITTSSALDPWANNGQAIKVSGALSAMASNGGLNTAYIGDSNLNDTANGKFLTADSNPYISSVAGQAADAAQARINAQFGSAGRSNGSGLYAQLFGQGIANASDAVYNANYQSERDRQQAAQSTLLGAYQSANEAALAREYGAQGSIFGAENSAAENAAARQFGAASNIYAGQNTALENAAQRAYGASTNIFGAQNASAENAAQRAASAYAAERGLQTSAAGNLLSSQLAASGQIPGILSAITDANNSAANAGEYEDNAALNRQQQYIGLLSQLAAPYGQSSGTSTTTQSMGLGSILGSIAGAGLAGWGSSGFHFGK